MGKRKLEINVLEAAKERIKYTFDNFERIYVSFSAGKDSTVMLHLVMEEAIKRKRNVGVLLVDLEAQYQHTIEHALNCFKLYKKYIIPFWVSLPLNLRNAVSVYEPFWKCWDTEKKKLWVRQPPKTAITDTKYFNFFKEGMEFEDFVPKFGEWFSRKKKTACLVGIRTDESLNRYRAIESGFTTQISKHLHNVYPIYDWKVDDIWIYHNKTKKPHNKIYDLMYSAGCPLVDQRICQPYGDDQKKGLWLFHILEPKTWEKLILRVNGVNTGALYIKEQGNINGNNYITKPEQHTWKSFSEHLINSMPVVTKKQYKEKISIFINKWVDRCYIPDIPDEVYYNLENLGKVPSYRRICKAVLKNDFQLKTLGFSQPKSKTYGDYLNIKYNGTYANDKGH